jgi:mxaD protein
MPRRFLNGTVTRSVDVHVSPQRVWRRLSDIGNLASWIVGIKKCVITSRKRRGVGATRLITFQDGFKIEEQIVTWNSGKSFSYLVIGKNLPFRAYFATLSIKSLGRNSTKITWAGYIGTSNFTKSKFKKTITEYDSLYKNSLPRLKSLIEQ